MTSNDADPIGVIQKFLNDKTKNDKKVKYASCSAQMKMEQSYTGHKKFKKYKSEGEVETIKGIHSSSQGLTVIGEIFKNNSVQFFSTSLDDTILEDRYLEYALRSAYNDKIETKILIPDNFKIEERLPKIEVIYDDMKLFEWGISEDLTDDLKNAANIPTRARKIIVRPELHLNINEVFFADTENNYAQHQWSIFGVGSTLYSGNLHNKHSRSLGFSPKSETDLKKIYSLIKYVDDIDIYEGQPLKNSESFEELASEQLKLIKYWDKVAAKIPQGKVNVITPFTTLPHEYIATHASENEILAKKQTQEDMDIVSTPFLEEGYRVGPKTLNIYDDPDATVGNLFLYGTRKVDMEGFKMTKKQIVNNGFLTKRKLGSKYSIGNEFGNALSDGSLIPQSRGSVTYTAIPKNGVRTLEELLECAPRKGKTILCVKGSGHVNTESGDFWLGYTGGEVEISMDTYLIEKENGHDTVTPIKNSHAFVGYIPNMGYKNGHDIILGGKSTKTISVGSCGKDSIVNNSAWDWVPSSQIGPVALITNMYMREIKTYSDIKF